MAWASGDLEAWRTRCGLASWDAAAAALGISRRAIYRAKAKPEVERWLELACAGYEAGLAKGDG